MKMSLIMLLCAVLFSTNSIAAGGFTTPIIVGDSLSDDQTDWPGYTSSVLWQDYYNHAIYGEWLSVRNAELQIGMAANIVSYLDLHPDADSLIIFGGVNDFARSRDADTVKSALQYMLAEAKTRTNIQAIIVMSPTPVGGLAIGWTQEKQDELETYLAWLPGYLESQQIDYLDTYNSVNHADFPWKISDGTNGEPTYTDDGLHLNEAGATKVAGEIDLLIAEIRNRPLEVDLDLDPLSAANDINLLIDETVTVAVLGMSVSAGDAYDFDATQVDPEMVWLGPNEAQYVSASVVDDIDGDSQLDLLIDFSIVETGIACGDTTVDLTGATYAGDLIFGEESINTVHCEEPSCH